MKNLVILIGRVSQQPEFKQLENNSVVKFSLATSETFKNKAGEKVENTEFHNIVFWGKLSEIVNKFVNKGDLISVDGKITYRSYEDKQGNKKYFTEIIGSTLKMLGSKKDQQTKPQDFAGEPDLKGVDHREDESESLPF